MEVSSVTSNVNALNVKNATAVQPKNQPARTREVGNDKDKDNGTSKAVAPRHSINTSGQVVGRIINTKA
ncbi:MAG: hypothetical protein PHD65_07450 [Gallionella sp.]|nr:hypothetical protein [Gallionella sp.]